MPLPTPDRNGSLYDWAIGFIRALPITFQERLATGQATLSTGTSTTVSVAGLTKRQRVFLQPRIVLAWDAKPAVASVADGSFVIAHLAGSSGRTVDYLVV
jgi:hypothetical protein